MSICHKEFILSHSDHEESYIGQNGKNARTNNNRLEKLCKGTSSQSLALGTACCLKVSFPFFCRSNVVFGTSYKTSNVTVGGGVFGPLIQELGIFLAYSMSTVDCLLLLRSIS